VYAVDDALPVFGTGAVVDAGADKGHVIFPQLK
jgi:hypothetical protein